MGNNPVPETVREYIANHIDSVAELEALLLMRSDPQVAWSAAALAERLYISQEQAGSVAERLCAFGLAECGDKVTYLYRPDSPELDALVGEIVQAYSKYLIPVTNLIHSKPQSKVQQFADAFKLRKRRDE